MTQLYSALHEIYLLQETAEETVKHEAWCSLFAEGFTWKQISLTIEQIDCAQERFYLRSLEFLYISEYITAQWKKLDLDISLTEKNTKHYIETIEKGLFLFDLQWQTQINFLDWQKKIDEAENSIRFRLAREGFDLHALQNFSKPQAEFLKNQKDRLINVINSFLFEELQIESAPLLFFKIPAHSIYAVTSGKQVATTFTISLLLMLLLLRLEIPLRAVLFNQNFFLEIVYSSANFYLGVQNKVKIFSDFSSLISSLSSRFSSADENHADKNFPLYPSLQVIFQMKLKQLKTLCKEFPQEEQYTKHLNFLQTLEKNLFS